MLIRADARSIPLAGESVHCVVTSPPYWGLREYGVDGQLGLEPTIEEYVEHMVEVFREVRRVLRSDGTLWLNLGDCYAGTSSGDDAKGRGHPGNCRVRSAERTGPVTYSGPFRQPNRQRQAGLKPKDLCGIPWTIAFALRDDGWYLRSEIIWAKPNPLPESVTDRPTKSHEQVFLLAKSPRYFYDTEAVREPQSESTLLHGWREGAQKRVSIKGLTGRDQSGLTAMMTQKVQPDRCRNRRSVWTIATESYPGAHFATFPEALVKPCILAGTSAKGCCVECGAPWRRNIEHTGHVNRREPAHVPGNSATKADSTGWAPTTRATDLWEPGCSCATEDRRPAVVFDPFVGSGTTVEVARDLGREGVGLDLSHDYLHQQARRRIQTTMGLEALG